MIIINNFKKSLFIIFILFFLIGCKSKEVVPENVEFVKVSSAKEVGSIRDTIEFKGELFLFSDNTTVLDDGSYDMEYMLLKSKDMLNFERLFPSIDLHYNTVDYFPDMVDFKEFNGKLYIIGDSGFGVLKSSDGIGWINIYLALGFYEFVKFKDKFYIFSYSLDVPLVLDNNEQFVVPDNDVKISSSPDNVYIFYKKIDDKLYAISDKDVYESSDFKSWNLLKENVLLVDLFRFKNKLYLAGYEFLKYEKVVLEPGYPPVERPVFSNQYKIWQLSDSNWSEIYSSNGFVGITEFNDYLYALGKSEDFNDKIYTPVYRSKDGSNWIEVDKIEGLFLFNTAFVFKNRLYISTDEALYVLNQT